MKFRRNEYIQGKLQRDKAKYDKLEKVKLN